MNSRAFVFYRVFFLLFSCLRLICLHRIGHKPKHMAVMESHGPLVLMLACRSLSRGALPGAWLHLEVQASDRAESVVVPKLSHFAPMKWGLEDKFYLLIKRVQRTLESEPPPYHYPKVPSAPSQISYLLLL